jgi:hypothetical protein
VLLIASAVGLIAILGSAYALTRRGAGARSGIAPAGELQRKHGLYAKNRPVIRLDPEQVPVYLRPLITLAEKWGIGDDIIRNDCIAVASEAEKRELHDAFYEPFEQITVWIDGFGPAPLSKEAEAFMYSQMALDEMGFSILEEKAREREGRQ